MYSLVPNCRGRKKQGGEGGGGAVKLQVFRRKSSFNYYKTMT